MTKNEIQAHRREWVNALRSGAYDRASGQLRTAYGYCCIGVACDLYAEATGAADWDEDTFLGREYYAAESVLEYFGLTDQGSRHDSDKDIDSQYRYAGMNDEGASFDEIADAIEKNLL